MTKTTPITFSTTDRETLEYFQSVLYSFLVRNNNQHRRSVWWRHFSTFRRQLDLLTRDVVDLLMVPTTNLARTKKKSKDRETQNNISQRLQFWQDVQVPKWQHAFSQVIADGRFAVLGLVLYATLAQVCIFTGLTAQFEDLGQQEIQRVLEAFRKEEWRDERGGLEEREGVEDVGEVVQREEDVEEKVVRDGNHEPLEGIAVERSISPKPAPTEPPELKKSGEKRAAPEPTPKKAPKNRKKKGNAIDDLFSGL